MDTGIARWAFYAIAFTGTHKEMADYVALGGLLYIEMVYPSVDGY